MNEHTLVTVHGYAGDQHQIEALMPWYVHHECPVIIMSPDDSRVTIAPHICRYAGQRAYIGRESLDRQVLHMKMALQYDFDFYLMNDSDSFCVSPELPRYLYDESHFFWSNECGDPRTHPTLLPRIAMQPPYFVSRKNLEKMVEVAPRVEMHPITPYIDHFMLQLVYAAGLEHRPFTTKEKSTASTETDPWEQLYIRTRHGGCLFHHPIKRREIAERIHQEHLLFKQHEH